MKLDFGVSRVKQSISKQFSIINKGMYPVDFQLIFLKQKYEQLFDIDNKKFTLESTKK